MISIVNVRIKDIVVYMVLAACVAFQSCYALRTVPEFTIAGYVLLVAAFICLLAMKPEADHLDSIWVVLLGAAVVVGVMVSTLWNSGLSIDADTIRLILILFVSILMVLKVAFSTFIRGFIGAMKALTLIALGVWVCVNLFRIELPLPEVANFRGLVYQVGILFFQSTQYMTDFGFYQCMSVFWEPGIYASFLLLAITLETCEIAERKPQDIILFAIAVVLTFSTAGIAMLPIALLPLLFSNKGKGSTALFWLCLVLVLVCVLNIETILQYLAFLNPSLFGKLVQIDLVTTATRLASPAINLEAWTSSPIVGLGLDGASSYYEASMSSISSVDSMTSTTTYLLAAFGVTGLLISVMWFVGILKMPCSSTYQKILLLLLFILIMNKETHTTTMVLYCFLLYFVHQAFNSPRSKS